jgi:uncharacterized protein YbjT (DUF2867 family)
MQARRRIAVTGATGRAGRHAVDLIEARGHEAVPIARSRGVDVITGSGLAEALIDVEAIIDLATWPTPDREAATRFFETSARNLQSTGSEAGTRRIVVASIVGADRFSGGYNAAKVAQEKALRAGPIPVRVLRATQFHEFVGQLLDWGRQGDVSHLPRMRSQLIAARSVAEALVDLAADERSTPADAETIEIAGPRVEDLVEVARLLAARLDAPARVEAAGDPSDPDAALYETDGLLPGPGATVAGPSFEEWLESEIPARA